MEQQVPHLTTALTGPLMVLEEQLLASQAEIEQWFSQQWEIYTPPIYSSVDLRNAGFKLAAVDTNLFPAGFNNLNKEFMALCIKAARKTIDNGYPGVSKILLIPENHTRNPLYWESLGTLFRIVIGAGFDCRIGQLLDKTQREIVLNNGDVLLIEHATRENEKLVVNDFIPDLILLNNDLAEGVPNSLLALDQSVTPSLDLGWSKRLKSVHFSCYKKICEQFSQLIDIDPWLISPLFRQCGDVNFMVRQGEACLVSNAEKLFAEIEKKYTEYGITHDPFIVVKADAGSYGMGIMTVKAPKELAGLNRKQRTRMSATKGQTSVNQVLLQEGIYTFETWGAENAVAEPVVYMLGDQVVGGFYRVHQKKAITENLNAPGMEFKPLAFVQSCYSPDITQAPNALPNRFYAYGVIARLASLAAAIEFVNL